MSVEVLQVRMGMSMQTAERLADVLLQHGPDLTTAEHRILDQLWLRTCLIEQRRRMRVNEREAFDVRADRMLAALDPTEDLATTIARELAAIRNAKLEPLEDAAA